MSREAPPTIRTIAFGDPGGRLWGAVRAPEAGGTGEGVVVIDGATVWSGPIIVKATEPQAPWTLAGDGVELAASPESEPIELSLSEQLVATDQLCRVTGTVSADGSKRAVESRGRRGTRPRPDWSRLDAVREVAGWFEPGGGLLLIALRPRGAAGHDRDLIAGAVYDTGVAIAVTDPRLSTTYDRTGLPARAGLELWMSDGEGEYPHRATGEPLHSPVSVSAPDLEQTRIPFRWRTLGREGAGVYELLEPGANMPRR